MAHNAKETSETHFCGVGLFEPQNGFNIGASMRAAGAFGASFLVASGQMYKNGYGKFQNPDTEMARKRLPCFIGVPSLVPFVPHDSEIVVIERTDQSTCLTKFSHPRRAFYAFGPEVGAIHPSTFQGLGIKVHQVSLPSVGSLNLAACVNLVLYDRLSKAASFNVATLTCPSCGGDHLKYSTDCSKACDGAAEIHCNQCGHNWASESNSTQPLH